MMNMVVGLILIANLAFASTFVGNGGNSKDVELQVTLLQIQKSLKQIQQEGSQNPTLCKCDPNLEGHPLCEVLKTLTPQQERQCRNELTVASSSILQLLQDPKGVQIIWTLEAMQVSEKAGLRQAEGVAVLKDKKIFLNRDEYMALKDYERIYLLTHELAHLVTFAGKYVQDDEKFGAFAQNDGGRQFLNALGASVAMKSFATGAISDYTASLNRSKNSKVHWISLGFTNSSHKKDEATFSIESYKGYHTKYRYQLNENWGVGGGFRDLSGKQSFYNSAETEGKIKLVEALISYRWLPFSDPFSIWGPSHFVFSVGGLTGDAEVTINDGLISVSDRARFTSPMASVEYFVPLIHGVWVQLGANFSNYNYELKEIGYQSEKNQNDYEFGVSYAF